MRIRRSLACAALLAAWVCVPAAAEDEKPEATAWLVAEADKANIDRAAYLTRVREIVDDVNAARRDLAGLEPLTLDLAASEGHYRHARYLLHHMKDARNSGGLTDFTTEPEAEFATSEGRRIARVAQFAVKYMEQGVPVHPATETWFPTVGYRIPLLARSAKTIQIGYAAAKVTEGEWQGYDWAVLVLTTDADVRYVANKMRADPVNAEPVIVPKDGATDVPLEIQREGADIVPPSIGKDDDGNLRKVGFPITVSYFGGAWLASGTSAQLFELAQVAKTDPEKPEKRRRPGQKRKKKPKKKKNQKVEYETKELELPCYVSTPNAQPLLGKAKTNLNSIVVIPESPLKPATTYRVKFEVFVGDGKDTNKVELTTTFKTREK